MVNETRLASVRSMIYPTLVYGTDLQAIWQDQSVFTNGGQNLRQVFMAAGRIKTAGLTGQRSDGVGEVNPGGVIFSESSTRLRQCCLHQGGPIIFERLKYTT